MIWRCGFFICCKAVLFKSLRLDILQKHKKWKKTVTDFFVLDYRLSIKRDVNCELFTVTRSLCVVDSAKCSWKEKITLITWSMLYPYFLVLLLVFRLLWQIWLYHVVRCKWQKHGRRVYLGTFGLSSDLHELGKDEPE